MCARRSVASWISGGLLIAAAGCGSDRPGEVGSGRIALGRKADLIVHAPGALAAQNDASIAANTDASILIAAYTDPRGALTSPVSLSGVARSADGGRSFSEVLGPNGETTLPSAAGAEVLGRPRVAYDPRRDRFVVASSYVRPGDHLQGVCLHVSGAGESAGTSWSAPVEVTPSFVAGERAEQASLDINAATGRLSVTWVQHGGATPRLMYSHSDDLGQTWSAAAVLAQAPADGWVDGPSPRVLPGTTDGDSIVYAVWRSIEAGTALRNIGCRRSTDGGATWEPAAPLDAAGYPPEDQIPGVDEARSSPSIDVDRATGDVYVVYQRSAAGGTGEIALRWLAGPCAPGSAVLLNSDPGNDRAQFFPFVAVDPSTGTVHVVYYDQDFAESGDMTEVMHTASSDHGVTWTPPAPISDRPFHAGYGNDDARRNLGELLGGVAAFGELYSVFGRTSVAPRFDEGQPASASMGTPDVAFDVLDEFARVAPLRVARVRVADAACGALANGRADPGEIIDFRIYLENYVANPASGATTVSGITATLSAETPLVSIDQASAAYPRIDPRRVAANSAPFQIRTARELVPGTPIDLTLTVRSDQGSIELPVRIDTGAPGAAEELLHEDFDAASAPALPAGWRSLRGHGASGSPWIVAQTLTPGDSAVFHDESQDASLVHLVSPLVTIPERSGESHVTLEFDLSYELEDDPQRLIQAYDGLALRIEDLTPGATSRAVLAEAFAERILMGSSLHFPKHLPATGDPAAARDLSVWSGSSRGKKHVSIRFPAAGMRGRTVQLRFDYIQDDSRVCTDVGRPGPCGVAIDNVVLSHVPVVSESCGADLAITQTDHPDPVAPGEQLTYTLSVRNDGPRDASDLVVTDVLPEGTTLVGAAGNDWTCTLAQEGLTCRRASLAAQESSSIAVTVNPPTVAGEQQAEIKNVAEVSAAEHDPDVSNNTSEEVTVVSMPALLIGYLTVNSTRVPGEEVAYTLSLTNTGGRTQIDNLDLEFLDVLPPELMLRGAVSTHGAVISDFAANSVGWSGHLDPGEWMILSIQATILPFTEGLAISNQGTIFYDADSDGVNEASVLTDEPLLGGAADPTILQIRPAICGDGVLGRGEACDDGNLFDGDCCSAQCTPEPTTVLCRQAISLCDPGEYCDGAGSCPPDRHMPDGFLCDDSDVCNGIEFCMQGACFAGIALDCDDGDPSTVDECHPRSGCSNIPVDPVSDVGAGAAGAGELASGAGGGVSASGAGGSGDAGAGGGVRTGGGGDTGTGGGAGAGGAGGDGGAGAGGAGGDGGAAVSGAGGDGSAAVSGAGGCGCRDVDGGGGPAEGQGGQIEGGDPPAPCCCLSCGVSGAAGGQAALGARPLALAGLLSLLCAGLARRRRHGVIDPTRARSSRRRAPARHVTCT